MIKEKIADIVCLYIIYYK